MLIEDLLGSLCLILVSLRQNEANTCSFVHAKAHGPENSVAGDLARPRSDSWMRRNEKDENDGNVDF